MPNSFWISVQQRTAIASSRISAASPSSTTASRTIESNAAPGTASQFE